jgi:hypothetical protein
MERRELVQILAAAPAMAQGAKPYQPRFFTRDEYAQLDTWTDALIPTEPGSPGARAAQVGYYIDTVLLYAPRQTQETWRTGLAALRAMGSPPARALAKLAAAEASPSSAAERFFVTFKRMTVEAFCHAEIAQKEFFGYKGNRAVKEFPGCSA